MSAEWDTRALFDGIAEAVANEREACAKLAEAAAHEPGAQGYSGEPKHTDMHRLAKAIRARGGAS